MSHFNRKIDRLLSAPILKQLGILLFFVLAVLILFMLIRLAIFGLEPTIPHGEEGGSIDGFWWVFLHFSYPGHLILENGESAGIRVFAIIITLAGMVLFEGVFIGLTVNYLRSHITDYKKGLLRYKHSNHYVILGVNDSLVSLIQKILKESSPIKKEEIVVLSPQNSEDLIRQIENSFSKAICKNIFIYNGELKKNEFKKLCLDNTKEIFIIGESNKTGANNSNIEVLFDLTQIIKVNEEKNCYLHLPELHSAKAFRNFVFPKEITDKLRIQIFNSNQGWARLIWGSIIESIEEMELIGEHCSKSEIVKPLLSTISNLGKDDFLHIVIVGFNDMGQALLEHSLQMAHLQTNTPSQITIIDKNRSGREKIFLTEFENYSKIPSCNVNFIDTDIHDKEIHSKLIEIHNTHGSKMILFVCQTDSDMAFTFASTLPKILIGDNVPVYIYQAKYSGYVKMFSLIKGDNKILSLNSRYFGWVDTHSDFVKVREKLAMGIHQEYLNSTKELKNNNPYTSVPWKLLPENYKWSNRYQADAIVVKLTRAGLTLTKMDSNKPIFTFTPKVIELFSKMEHDRWCAEHYLAGWDYSNTRSEEKYLHPNLIPYDELDETTKKKDIDAILSIPLLLRKYCQLDIVPW